MADSGGLSIGTLSGQIELDDKFTATIHLSNEALDALEKRFGSVHGGAVQAAEGFAAAEIAIAAVKEVAHLAAETLKELTLEGSKVANVEQNFNRLELAAGNLGDELLGNLRQGTRNTITDFELMKSVNDNMAAGVKLTSDQYTTLSTGAFALAHAKGIEVKDAFDRINDALLTGKVRGVQYLTGKIDLADAEDKYAIKLGTTADRLTADEKIQATRIAILDRVNSATARLGEQQETLGERVSQISTKWQNFEEDLGKTVASSPVILQAFDDIGSILTQAFGTDKEHLIETITHDLEDTAQAVVEVVRTGVEVVQFVNEYKAVLEPLAVGLGVYYSASILAAGGTKLMAVATQGLTVLASPLGAIALTAAAIYAAYEVGKWQPVSDFFERLGLRVFYGLSSAEADAAVQAHHLTDEMTKGGRAAEESAAAHHEIEIATQNYKQVLDTIDGSIVSWAEHLLSSGVSAKSVATEYGLTDAQVKALEQDIAAGNQVLAEAEKRAGELEEKMRLSRQEMKQFVLAWESLNTIGLTYKATLDSVSPSIRASVEYYAQLGAKVDDLTKAFPGLTKAQAEAAVIGAKAARELEQVWADTFAITAKMHGENINDFIKLETMKFNIHLEQLRQDGKLTDEQMEAEKAKFNATIEAEIAKRASQIEGSRALRQKDYDDARNTLDLMLKDSADFSDDEIRQQRLLVAEKGRLLNNWRAANHEALQSQASETNKVIEDEIAKVEKLNNAFRDLHETMAGGSFDVTSQNFESTLQGMITAGGWNPSGLGSNISISQAYQWARMGYSMAEITRMFNLMKQGANGPLPPAQGPRIPGFKEGGYGDFGTGTQVELHGQEAVIPLSDLDIMQGKLADSVMRMIERGTSLAEVASKMNFTEGEVRKMYDNTMAEQKATGVFGATVLSGLAEMKTAMTSSNSSNGDTNVFYINGTAEETARKVSNVMIERAKRRRLLGAA